MNISGKTAYLGIQNVGLLGKVQFPAETPLLLSDVDEILAVGIFHYADRKYN